MRSDPGWLGVGLVVGLVVASLSARQPGRGSGGVNGAAHVDKPHLVLVSLDGFKADYLDRFELPHLRRVMQRGTRARWMVPVFPTFTFPNHYSLVTGLYPERHGIVANSFYDPARQQKYSMLDAQTVTDGTWYRGEPIWVTAESQGMVSACFFWPGSEADIKGIRPTFVTKYDPTIPNSARVQTTIDWLRLPPPARPHVITLYFSELDSASHDAPLDSPAIERAAQSLDRAIGELLDGIDALPIRDRVYLLITSDHGMAEVTPAREIPIESLVGLDGILHTFDGAIASFHVTGGQRRASALRDALNARLQQGRAYLRQDLPERLHYDEDPRAGDVVVIMDEGWTLRRAAARPRHPAARWGTHGWDPALPSMRGIFLLMGPDVPGGVTIDEVHNVDVYPLMTELLDLAAGPDVDGRPGRIRRMRTPQ